MSDFYTAEEYFGNEEIYYDWFNKPNDPHFIVTAPTQVGKTNEIIELVKFFFDTNTKNKCVIISSDNKLSQLEQLNSRIEKKLSLYDNIEFIMASGNAKKNEEKIKNAMKELSNVIIFTLDNYKQIDNVGKFVLVLNTKKAYKKNILVIHDEGDVVQKDADPTSPVTKSCVKWNEIVEVFDENFDNYKRCFVTATPDNVFVKYKVPKKNIVLLDIPSEYVGYNKINYVSLGKINTNQDKFIIDAIDQFYESDSKVALLCIERTKGIASGHSAILSKIVDEILDNRKMIIHTYNGDGMTVYAKYYTSKLRKELIKRKIKFTETEELDYLFEIEDIDIPDFYQILLDIKVKKAITIGYDLMGRGLSFVSREHSDEPLAATTMIYKPSKALCVVKLVQQIGRITGTAATDEPRYLYSTDDVIRHYRDYHVNYYYNLKHSKINTVQIIRKYRRSLDRKQLKLGNGIVFIDTEESLSNQQKSMKSIAMKLMRKGKKYSTTEILDLLTSHGFLKYGKSDKSDETMLFIESKDKESKRGVVGKLMKIICDKTDKFNLTSNGNINYYTKL